MNKNRKCELARKARKAPGQTAQADSSEDDSLGVPINNLINAQVALIFHKKLSFLDMAKTSIKKVHDHPVNLLIDTAFPLTSMSTVFFEKISLGIQGKTFEKLNRTIKNADGVESKVTGRTQVRIKFPNGELFFVTTLIVEGLAPDLILGLDTLPYISPDGMMLHNWRQPKPVLKETRTRTRSSKSKLKI